MFGTALRVHSARRDYHANVNHILINDVTVAVRGIASDSTVARRRVLVSPVIARGLDRRSVASATEVTLGPIMDARCLFRVDFLCRYFGDQWVNFPRVAKEGVLDVRKITFDFQPTVRYVILNADIGFVMLNVNQPLRAFCCYRSRAAYRVKVFSVNLLAASPTQVAGSVCV